MGSRCSRRSGSGALAGGVASRVFRPTGRLQVSCKSTCKSTCKSSCEWRNSTCKSTSPCVASPLVVESRADSRVDTRVGWRSSRDPTRGPAAASPPRPQVRAHLHLGTRPRLPTAWGRGCARPLSLAPACALTSPKHPAPPSPAAAAPTARHSSLLVLPLTCPRALGGLHAGRVSEFHLIRFSNGFNSVTTLSCTVRSRPSFESKNRFWVRPALTRGLWVS